MKRKVTLFSIFAVFLLSAGFVYKLYLDQEHHLFRFRPLADDHEFHFDHPFEEHDFNLSDGAYIHSILFHRKGSRGVIAYYHGQGVNIETKGPHVADIFLPKGYDVMMMDYRGFGKSRGAMSEREFLQDALIPYDYLRERYGENLTVVYGSSLGTGVAAYVAAKRNPAMLILESPYYNMINLAKFTKPYLPMGLIEWILHYPIRTDLFMNEVKSATHIFHGTADQIIPYESSLQLLDHIEGRVDAELTTLKDTGHLSVTVHPEYHSKLEEILP